MFEEEYNKIREAMKGIDEEYMIHFKNSDMSFHLSFKAVDNEECAAYIALAMPLEVAKYSKIEDLHTQIKLKIMEVTNNDIKNKL